MTLLTTKPLTNGNLIKSRPRRKPKTGQSSMPKPESMQRNDQYCQQTIIIVTDQPFVIRAGSFILLNQSLQGMMQERDQGLQNYSLEADMITGWKPKMKIIGPMPLNFDNPNLDNLIKPLTYSDTSIHQVVYLGIRPRDTFEMHSFLAKNYRYKFRHLLTTDYSHLKPFFRKFYSEFEPECKMPFHGMNPKTKSTIVFQSRFESGNLDCVIRTKTNEYDLFLRIDSNTGGHIMWYYFKVSNTTEKGKTIRINICNLRRSKAFYDKCLQPYVLRQGIGWRQEANNLSVTEQRVRFYKEHLIFTNEEAIEPTLYRKLSFDLELKPHEEVQIAYSVPYTYSQMLEDIKTLKSEVKNTENMEFDIDMSNISLSGLEIPYIKIYSRDEKEQATKKQTLLLIGRQHPGQSNASHVLKGFMEELVKSRQKSIIELRNNFNFHIVPMLNPDGVVMGNFRTSLYGKDLNRLFRKNQTFMIPQIQFCKNLVFEITKKKKRKMFMFLDFHGHSVKKNAFCFAPSSFQTSSMEDVREFPKIISQLTEIFRFPSCSFRISNQKKTTARAVFCGDAKLCYTIQTSNWSYFSKNQKTNIYFDESLLLKLGGYLTRSLAVFYQRINERKQIRKRRLEMKPEMDMVLHHNGSGLFKVRPHKKFQLKTQQSQAQESINFIKNSQLSSIETQQVHPSSTRSVQNQSETKLIKQINSFPSFERITGQGEDEDNPSDDSDQSDKEDMDKEKFKKYMNGATRMFIQFQKAYYGDQYNAKARYEIPKKVVAPKKKQAAIVMQACLKAKNSTERKVIESQKLIGKVGFSEDKEARIKIAKRQESKKKLKVGTNQVEVLTKEEALKSLPRISIVNYLALQQINEKRVFRIPKIESVHIKNIRKY